MMEDIFAENLVDEPDDIERMVEGEETGQASDEGSDKEDEKDKDEKEKVKPKIRKKIGPRVLLNADRLIGPRGVGTIPDFFADLKLEGRRGTEAKDLEKYLKRLELWCHRLNPQGQFDDTLKKIEKLGHHKRVRNYVKRMRMGLIDETESEFVRDEPGSPPPSPSVEDRFDELVASTSGPPQVTSVGSPELTKEQREQMLMNRLIAEERRAARIKRAQELKEKFMASQAIQPNIQSNTKEMDGLVSNDVAKTDGEENEN